MMHLIHRNRVAFLGRLRCGPPSPAEKAYCIIHENSIVFSYRTLKKKQLS